MAVPSAKPGALAVSVADAGTRKPLSKYREGRKSGGQVDREPAGTISVLIHCAADGLGSSSIDKQDIGTVAGYEHRDGVAGGRGQDKCDRSFQVLTNRHVGTPPR